VDGFAVVLLQDKHYSIRLKDISIYTYIIIKYVNTVSFKALLIFQYSALTNDDDDEI